MAESAAHLVDEVFPKVGVRQWVLSFPMQIRFILAKNSKIQGGCLTLVHRAGGGLNLNVHYHMLFLEGGYYEAPTKNQDLGRQPQYAWVEAPTDLEIKD